MTQAKENSSKISKSRGTTIGIFLLLVTNILYVSNNYIVKISQLSAGETALVRGFIQFVVFGSLIIIKKRKFVSNAAETESLKPSKQTSYVKFLLIVAFGFLHSTASFSCITAVLLMPISDLIVLCFTAPVFSVILEALFLKRPLTILSIILCILIVTGDVFVVQPDFIFNAITSSNETQTTSALPEHDDPSYFIGVGLSLYTALAISLANIMQVIVSRLPNKGENNTTNYMMLASGLWSMLISTALLPVVPNRLVISPSSLTLVTGSMMLLAASVTLMAFWLMVTAVSITQNPTLVTMLRSTEICLSLITEAIYWNQFPDPLSAVGSFIVMFSVTLMSVNDKINLYWKKLKAKAEQRFN